MARGVRPMQKCLEVKGTGEADGLCSDEVGACKRLPCLCKT